MLPDRVSNPGPLTYESGALPIALRGPARNIYKRSQSELYHIFQHMPITWSYEYHSAMTIYIYIFFFLKKFLHENLLFQMQMYY